MKSEQYKCPICQAPLEVNPGTQINVTDGITIHCSSPIEVCGMADWGHGKNEKEAFEVFSQKCGKPVKQ